tara:strand:- start:897 stop:1046 length:150 start_codon:yes stop_codon:yes gene_type:complete
MKVIVFEIAVMGLVEVDNDSHYFCGREPASPAALDVAVFQQRALPLFNK